MSRNVFMGIAAVLIAMTVNLAQPTAAKAEVACTKLYTVQRGDTLYAIARYSGVSIAKIQSINGMEANTLIYVGQQLCLYLSGLPNSTPTPNPTGKPYIVQPGDTILRIAARFGINWRQLAAANNLYNPNLIYAGQTIYIPQFATQ